MSSELFDRAVNLAREAGDPRAEGQSLHELMLAHQDQGDFDGTIAAGLAAVEVARRAGERREEGWYLADVSWCQAKHGEFSAGLRGMAQALEIARQVGDQFTEAFTTALFGCVYGKLGQYKRALDLLQVGLAKAHSDHNRRQAGLWLRWTGMVGVWAGQGERALGDARAAVDIAREFNPFEGARQFQ